MPLFDYVTYIRDNQLPDTPVVLKSEYNTSNHELVWAAAQLGWTPPSSEVIPVGADGQPVAPRPTLDDDLASLKAWAVEQLKQTMLNNLSRAKLQLEAQRKEAERRAALEEVARNTRAFIESKLVVRDE